MSTLIQDLLSVAGVTDFGSAPPESSPIQRDSYDDLDARWAVEGEDDGLIWHVLLVPDGCTDPQICRADGSLKPRRGLPQMFASEFFAALRSFQGNEGQARWVLPAIAGGLNGWPGLACDLELVAVTGKVSSIFTNKTSISSEPIMSHS